MRAWILGVLLVVFGVLQFTPGVGVRDASALVLWTGGPDSPCYVNSYNNFPAVCSRQDAYDACMMHNNYWKTHGYPNANGCYVDTGNSRPDLSKGTYYSRLSSTNTARYFNWGYVCPAAETWDDVSHTCFSPERCLAKTPVQYGLLNVSVGGMHMCQDGCDYEARDGTDSNLTTHLGDVLHTYYGGAYKPTGQPCTSGQNGPQPPKKQECVPIEGMTACKRDDGKLCASASTGKQICWNPGETGEKGDGPLLQVRNAGGLPASPQTPPPPGDSFQQQGNSHSMGESIGGGTTINTTITNYTTGSGVNAVGSGGSSSGGSGNSGEPADGSGSGSGGGSGDSGETNGLLSGIKDKLSSLYDGLTGDGLNHAGDGADPSDTNVWSEDEPVDGSTLDSSGWLGGAGSCPALWDAGGEGLAGAFAIETPAQWCDFIGWLRLILIATATITGIVILAKGGKG